MLSYAQNIKDSLGCVHSIDNLVVEFAVKDWNTGSVLDSLVKIFSDAIPGWERSKCCKENMPACSKFSWFKSAIWGGGFNVKYGHYRNLDKATREWDEFPLLRVEFNPNKYWHSPVLKQLLAFFDTNCDNGCLVKFDYAVDVPARSCDIVVHSRKEPGLYKGTRYYGQRNKHGRLKIYDKKAEADLPDDTTRVEWTFCLGKPIVFDNVLMLTNGPAPLPDAKTLGGASYNIARLLLNIRSLGGDVAESLSLFDPKTQKKLEPYTIGSGVQLLGADIVQLSALLLAYCNALSVSFHADGVNKVSIGTPVARASTDDLENDDRLPF